jgi:pimeloyl-ACP methyl ester carboxylesterase
VEPGVWLEVLDWGGEHKPQTMVLLTGLGDNAHVYDQFAQQFTDSFHVIGITRRGFVPSSQPRNGYDVETRARDDIAVLDALRIARATFVGHSLAGSELAKLGEVHGNRVDKLVFLDATDLADRFSPSRAEPPGQEDLFVGDALKSLWAFQAASARYSALRKPDAAVCIDTVFGPKGELLESKTPDWVSDKLLQGVTGAENPRVNWASIVAPRLGVFAQYTLEGRQAYYWYLSAAKQAEFDRAWPSIVAWHKDTIDRFADGNPTPTVRLYGVPHYVYINNETEVVREMRKFLGLQSVAIENALGGTLVDAPSGCRSSSRR